MSYFQAQHWRAWTETFADRHHCKNRTLFDPVLYGERLLCPRSFRRWGLWSRISIHSWCCSLLHDFNNRVVHFLCHPTKLGSLKIASRTVGFKEARMALRPLKYRSGKATAASHMALSVNNLTRMGFLSCLTVHFTGGSPMHDYFRDCLLITTTTRTTSSAQITIQSHGPPPIQPPIQPLIQPFV